MRSRRALALAIAAALGASAGCAPTERAIDAAPQVLGGWSPGHYRRPGAPETLEPLASAQARVAPGALCLLSLRSMVRDGSFELRAVDEPARLLARRRVVRLGDNLDLLLVAAPPDGRFIAELAQPAGSGPLDVELGDLLLRTVNVDTAGTVAGELARQFETETGRLAAPAEGNLVPNADFTADDEVRGTPADWCAYVATEVDTSEHTLRAAGAPFGERPYLASGPVVVRPGARYRALCRLRAREGTVVLRVLDYDEITDLAVAPGVTGLDGTAERVLEFSPGAARAVRLWFAPPTPGAAATFDVHAIQLERLPDVAP